METNEEIDVLDQEEEINIYDDICNFDLGEEIERLKTENKKLEEHICSLKADIDRLNGTIAELKVTQNNLTKNISSLFMTAKTEIERKNRMIEELREKVENRRLRSFKPDFKKRKDRENSPSETNKSKRYKYDESTKCEVQGVPDNDKLEPEPDERQELQSKYSNRQRPVDDSRYQQRFKYPYNKYSNQFENNKYDSKLRYSNETYTESNKFEFKNKHYNDRYNNYEDDGYHSRSTYSYDRYRNEMEERYDSRSQYCNDSYNNWTNNRIGGDGTYDNRDYYNRSSRSNVEDRDGGQERFDTYADNRRNDQCDSSYYRNERNRSFERPGRSRSGTPFTPFASDVREDTSQNIERDASNVAVNSETNRERERSLTPMPLPEDIDEPNPKPPKKRLKMLEDMEKKVRQNRLSQTTRLSDQCATNMPSDINKHNHAWSYDIDRNSVTSSKSTKSSKSDRESQGSAQRKEANLVKEKVSVKNKTGGSKEKFSPRDYDIHPKKDIKQSPKKETTNIKRKIDNTVEHHMKERISKLFCSPLKLNNEKCKMTNECVSKEPKQKCSKISNAETEQKSNVKESSVKRVEKDVQRTANNEQHMKEMISKLFHSPLKLNNEIPKMTNERVSKEPKQKCSKISNAETEQKSNVQESSVKRVEKDVQMTANNGSQKHTQKEIRSSTKNSPEALSVHRNQPEDKILKKPSQIVKISPGNNLSNKRDKKREDKIKETKNQENTDKAKDFENIGKPSENVNKSTKAATNEEIVQKRRNTPHSFEEPCNSEKPSEDGKENIRKQSVGKDLNMDKVDGQGKTEEKVVAKAVMPEELKTTEESVKYSQRHSIRSSKERVVASKDGTTESEQKDKNVEEGKENIGKQSVDKGLNMDNIDGQGKMEEKVVAKVAMHIELKTTEESEKYSQRHSTRSSKERVDASKDGTTESEQKDKNVEEGKENIRKKSVDKGLNKDNVDGQGKTEEKVVAKAVMPKELKTTEESVKYSQRHNIRSSKERVVASKEGTTESEQKDKNVEEGIENIGKQSVDKGLIKDNVDGQGKAEEKVVAKAVVPKELKTTEESVKYSQRHNIRSSKERVAASKDGTIDSEQKDKNVEEGKKTIRNQSVDKELNMDNVDGQGKTEEKVVAKAVMPRELKTTEESVKYSQRYSIRSSKERVVASEDTTTESEQKNKNVEEGKENIRKQSVDKELNKDNVDGQGKTEEKVVANAVMPKELKTTDESVKCSQRHSIRSSKEKVAASKDGTTESEQKDKNVGEGKETIRKQSVDKELIMDNVDGQGKTEEKVVAKAVMPRELKTTEESVKYSQRYSIRSSKERVVASKDATTESEQTNKNVEGGKENIRKQSVDKGLNMDNVDGQGKTEEKVVANAVMPKELKTTEESVKYSQRHSIRSSKETVAASKDGTTESEQKDKNVGEGKENIRKQSVDKGLHKDNGDGQGKIEEKVIVKVAMKTTEESVKHSIQSSREKVVAFKEGTTESEQKDKNAEETTRRNNKKVEKQDVKDTDKEQKQKEIIKWPSKMDKPNNKTMIDEKRQNKDDIKQASDLKGKGSNKPSRQPTADAKPKAAKQEVTKEDRRKDKSPISKKDVKDKDTKIDQSKKEYNQLIENLFVESERKEGLKENLEGYTIKGTNKQLETNKNKDVQSEHNIELAQKNAKRKRKKSDSADQYSNIKNKDENPVEHFTKKEKKREGIISKGDEIRKIKESEPSLKQKKGEHSMGSMVKQSPKDIALKQDVDTDVPIQTDEKVIEQCMAVSSKVIQKQAEKRPMEIFDDKLHVAKQDLTDDKNTKHEESIKMKKSVETATSNKNIHKNEDNGTNTNQVGQRKRVSDVRRRIRFADKGPEDQNGHNKVPIKKNNICKKITEVDQVVLEESEKEQQNNSDGINVTTIKTDDSADKNKKVAENSKNKNPTDSPKQELLTEVVTHTSMLTTSSSTDSETDSEEESSDDIFSSIKTVNKLIEIKDVEQERSKQIESVISLSDSSTSDDTVVMSYVNDSKTIEKKFDDLVSRYMENFTTENISDNPEKVLHTAIDYSQPAPNTDNAEVEVESQANHLLKENVYKTSEPKIKVLEVINIVNVHKKIELFKSSNNEEVTMVKSKECNTEKPVTTCSNSSNPANQNISPRSARRRITPTPVKDHKPLCSFENILTKTSQPDPFTVSLQSISSPLQLTHEGEIPILHLDENHINDLPTEVNINDKNIMNLLDSMNISNIECDIPKFKSFSAEAAANSEATNAIGGSGCGLTFENKIEQTTSTPIKSQVTKSGVSNVPNCGGASTSNASSNTQAGAAPSTIRRRRRRCWMIVKD